MKIEQVYSLVNQSTKDILGETDIVKQDLSNIVDIGTSIINSNNVDNYVKSLVDHIGKVIFVNRPYAGSVSNVLMDKWEFGSVLEKISADLPDAVENKSWELTNGVDYSPNVFYKPTVSTKFYNSKVTFEVDMSFTERQVKESFSNAEQLNAFVSMLYNAVERSMTVKIDSLVMSTINNAIAQVVNHVMPDVIDGNYSQATSTPQAINLLKVYNDTFTKTLTKANCLRDTDFLKWCCIILSTYAKRVSRMSTLFNVGGKPRFTPKEDLNIIMLQDFYANMRVNLASDTYNKEDLLLPTDITTIPYWQGSGNDYSDSKVAKINVAIKTGESTTKDIEMNGIMAIMFDRNALGVCNMDRRVTTNYNPKAEFYNNFYKFDCSYFNDLDENFIVFFIQ